MDDTGAPDGVRQRRRLTPSWLLLAVVLLVAAADVAVVAARSRGPSVPISVAVAQGLLTESPRDATRRADRRDAAIDDIFARRADAILRRDRAAFLADVDPAQAGFRAQQDEVFTSLGRLDFAAWSYERTDDSYAPGDIDYRRYGRVADLWLPVLHLRYQLDGFDDAEVGRRVVYTVVRRGQRWYIGGDADLEKTTTSGTSVRVDPWENGPILVEKGRHGVVIGHPDDADAIDAIRTEVDDAVGHVTRYVGRGDWNGKVVVVLPTDQDELDRVLESPTVFFDFSAIARPLVSIPREGEDAEYAGARVVINPEGFDAGSAFTRHLIRHEITHVAMFERVGPLTPKWLIEGVAEYVGNAGSDLPSEALAGDLAEQIGREGVPETLPTDSDFGLINDAGIGYNSAWLLCRYIASRWGRAALLRFHDRMGTLSGLDRPSEKLPRVLRQVLGTDEASLLRGWQPFVRAALADLATLLASPGAAYRRLSRGRLRVKDVASLDGVRSSALVKAGFDRAAGGIWLDGPFRTPRRRVATTLVVLQDEAGARTVERLLAEPLRRFDAGTPIPHGRLFSVGTTIGGRHYNQTVSVVRAGTVVFEVRIAVPGTGDSSAENRRLSAAQYAAVT